VKTVLLYIICFASGFLIAYSISTFYQNQFAINGTVGYVVILSAVFGIIGVLFTVIKSAWQFYRSPSLEFGQTTVNLHREYFVRIHKKGTGIAKNCEGIINSGDININSVWGRGDKSPRVISIAESVELKLFHILDKEKQIVFSKARPNEWTDHIVKPLNEYVDMKIKLTIHSENARSSIETTRTVKEIIDSAVYLQGL
jgi:hypothetical protein